MRQADAGEGETPIDLADLVIEVELIGDTSVVKQGTFGEEMRLVGPIARSTFRLMIDVVAGDQDFEALGVGKFVGVGMFDEAAVPEAVQVAFTNRDRTSDCRTE